MLLLQEVNNFYMISNKIDYITYNITKLKMYLNSLKIIVKLASKISCELEVNSLWY